MENVYVKQMVGIIDEWLGELSKGNNSYQVDDEEASYEWSYGRMASLVPIEEYNRLHLARYDYIDRDDLPEDTTHMLIFVLANWSNTLGTSYFGYRMPVRVDGTSGCAMLEDTDECLGGGPSLQDATYDEAYEWVSECTSTDIIVYDEVDMSTVQLTE